MTKTNEINQENIFKKHQKKPKESPFFKESPFSKKQIFFVPKLKKFGVNSRIKIEECENIFNAVSIARVKVLFHPHGGRENVAKILDKTQRMDQRLLDDSIILEKV